jgi:hypothetical protein
MPSLSNRSEPKRPTEDAHVNAGHQFKMTDELKEKIKKTERKVKNYEMEHEDQEGHHEQFDVSALEL